LNLGCIYVDHNHVIMRIGARFGTTSFPHDPAKRLQRVSNQVRRARMPAARGAN